MKDLKESIKELETITDKKEIESKLQLLGEKLINDYYIEVEGIKVEPLWVEAYYYNETRFADCNTHMHDLQKNRFGQLYFHRIGHGGFDICLSLSENYYLSFLLKASLINGKFNRQTDIESSFAEEGKSKETLENAENILIKRENSLRHDVKFSKRVGVTKSCYAEDELAIYAFDALGNKEYNFTFAHKDLTPLAVETIKKYKQETNCTKKEGKNKCTELFGWTPDAVGKLFDN